MTAGQAAFIFIKMNDGTNGTNYGRIFLGFKKNK